MTGEIRSFYFYKPFFVWKKFMQNFEHGIDMTFVKLDGQCSDVQKIFVLKVIHIVLLFVKVFLFYNFPFHKEEDGKGQNPCQAYLKLP